jgi:outer membrane protein OmpA-like peptidoglycan-associated protein
MDLTEQESVIVEGKFEYKNLPLVSQALVVLDENGFPLDTIYTDRQGKFNYSKLKGENYTIKLLEEDNFSLDDLVLLEEELASTEVVKSVIKTDGIKEVEPKNFVLENKTLLFEFNDAVISQKGVVILNDLVSHLSDLNSIVIEGHTDDVGTEAQNMIVANMRVDSVFNYLVEKGFNPEKLVKKPIGEKVPTVRNSTEKNRARNRRIELLLR